MKKLTSKIVALLFVLAIGFSGCEPEEETPSDCGLDVDLEAYQQIALRFSNNPTTANCNTLKNASFELLRKVENCSGEMRATVQELTNTWKSIDCNEFD